MKPIKSNKSLFYKPIQSSNQISASNSIKYEEFNSILNLHCFGITDKQFSSQNWRLSELLLKTGNDKQGLIQKYNNTNNLRRTTTYVMKSIESSNEDRTDFNRNDIRKKTQDKLRKIDTLKLINDRLIKSANTRQASKTDLRYSSFISHQHKNSIDSLFSNEEIIKDEVKEVKAQPKFKSNPRGVIRKSTKNVLINKYNLNTFFRNEEENFDFRKIFNSPNIHLSKINEKHLSLKPNMKDLTYNSLRIFFLKNKFSKVSKFGNLKKSKEEENVRIKLDPTEYFENYHQNKAKKAKILNYKKKRFLADLEEKINLLKTLSPQKKKLISQDTLPTHQNSCLSFNKEEEKTVKINQILKITNENKDFRGFNHNIYKIKENFINRVKICESKAIVKKKIDRNLSMRDLDLSYFKKIKENEKNNILTEKQNNKLIKIQNQNNIQLEMNHLINKNESLSNINEVSLSEVVNRNIINYKNLKQKKNDKSKRMIKTDLNKVFNNRELQFLNDSKSTNLKLNNKAVEKDNPLILNINSISFKINNKNNNMERKEYLINDLSTYNKLLNINTLNGFPFISK